MRKILVLSVLSALVLWWLLSIEPGDNLPDDHAMGDLSTFSEHGLEMVKPTEIIELNDGDVFDLEATIVKQEVGNRVIKRLAYNGQIPGPVIKVQKGSKITVNFTNNIDMETALHSHGLRGDWRMDGAVPITPPIEIGETFSYELVFPDAGVYWYHPHVREDYQQELGLYGNFIVEEDGYWGQADREEYLVVDDMLENGEFTTDHVTNTLMGRYGDRLLINDQEDFRLNVNQGEVVRLFITNVANTRTFDLKFTGADMKLVGGDLGRIEKEMFVDSQIIAPAERYVLDVLYQESGTYTIDHRGKKIGEVVVGESQGAGTKDFSDLRTNNDDYSNVRLHTEEWLSAEPDKNLRLDIVMGEMGGGMHEMHNSKSSSLDSGKVSLMGIEMTYDQAVEHCQMMPEMAGCEPYLNPVPDNNDSVAVKSDGIEWEDDMLAMNNMSTDHSLEWVIEDIDAGQKNGDIHWSFKVGDMVKVRVYNDPNSMHPMQHPLHFHGQRFLVLARDGEVNDNFQWKDTVLIPKGQSVDLLIDMSNPGKWMAHCHIAEHLHAGMMFHFSVEE